LPTLAFSTTMRQVQNINDWKVDVRFKEKGNLQAIASGVLLVPPSDALALVTDSGAPQRSIAVVYCRRDIYACKHVAGGCAVATPSFSRHACHVEPPTASPCSRLLLLLLLLLTLLATCSRRQPLPSCAAAAPTSSSRWQPVC
jgi:hypothetical protein